MAAVNPNGTDSEGEDREAFRLVAADVRRLKLKGLKARKKIAQGKASLRATPWVDHPQNFQALKGRKKSSSTLEQILV